LPQPECRERSSRIFVLLLHGKMGMDTVPGVFRFLSPIFKKSPARLILDLSRVSHMDTSGVAVLVRWFRKCRDRGVRFVLAGPSRSVMALLEIDKVRGLFEVVPPVVFAERAGLMARNRGSSAMGARGGLG
jgi:anti-sigma B factor antagonist